MFEFMWKFGLICVVYWFGFDWFASQSNWHNHNVSWYVIHYMPALPSFVALVICALLAAWWAK
jgi:hypothetical protein